MASASFVSSACDISTACNTSVSFTVPTVTASQLIFVGVTLRQGNSPTVTPPAGFTGPLLTASAGTIISASVFYRVADGTESSPCTFDFSASTRAAVITEIWDNIETACPFDVYSVATTGTTSSACCEFPIVNVTSASTALTYFTGTASNPAITNDANLTEREEVTTLGGNRCQSWAGDELQISSGNSACRVNTLEAAQRNITFTVALKAASVLVAAGVTTGRLQPMGIIF